MAFEYLSTSYAGRRGPMFRLALKTGVLTVLSLGLYRFWMKTRMRHYYWSALRPGGVPMEYVGRPTEKLLGFLTAVVVLAFYIGVVNLILMFLSFSLLQDDFSAYALSFLGLVPMIFFAQYRARRYVLARTRWRGIRFGLEPGVWGYVWRAAVHWGLTLLTAGVLWPRMTFALEKYRTNRTWFGDQKLEQTGRWWSLVGAMKHVYFGVFLFLLGLALVNNLAEPIWSIAAAMGAIWAAIGLAYWKAQSFKRLTEGKRVGDMGFRCTPSTGSVLGIYIGGSSAMGAILTGITFALLLVIGLLVGMMDPAIFDDGMTELNDLAALPGWIATALGVVLYFAVFLFWGVLREVFITLPLARHFAETTEIVNPAGLGRVRQRDRDEVAEAEGFADALPLGGGF